MKLISIFKQRPKFLFSMLSKIINRKKSVLYVIKCLECNGELIKGLSHRVSSCNSDTHFHLISQYLPSHCDLSTMVRWSMSKREISYAVLILPLHQIRRKTEFLLEEQAHAMTLNWDAKSPASARGFPPAQPLASHLFSLCLHPSANGGDINSHTSSVALICLLTGHW